MTDATTEVDAPAGACPKCGVPHPEVARFCGSCGTDVRAKDGGGKRRGSYAAHPGQGVWSLDVVTSLMPLASGGTTDAFRWAIGAAVGLPLLAAVLGFVSFALAAAAVAVPVVYLLYLYDVNEWEDAPLSVVLGTTALAGALAVAWTLVWSDLLLDGTLSLRVDGNDFVVDGQTLVVIGVLAPIVAVLLAQIGPIWLASQRRFDDLLDGLTFGVAAGAAYAGLETLMLNRDMILDGPGRLDSPDLGAWLSVVLVAGLLKPIVFGSAVGLAVAGWSGRGEGYDGFGGGYLRGLAEAIVGVVSFSVGLYLTGRIGGTAGLAAGALWAVVVAVVLLLRVRLTLHTALLEGALEATTAGTAQQAASRGIGFCSECEMPLLDEAGFCVVCGTSVRAASKLTRNANAEPGDAKAGSGSFPAPALAEWGSGATPAEGARRSTAVMVGAAIVLVALVAGLFAVVDATSDDEEFQPQQIEAAAGPPAPALARGEVAAGPSMAAAAQFEPTDDTTPFPPEDGGSGTDAGGVSFDLPAGWEVFDQTETYIGVIDTESYAGVIVEIIPGGPQSDSAEESVAIVVDAYIEQILSQEIQDLQGEFAVFDVGVPGIEAAGNFYYQGSLVTQQGSSPIEGDAEVLISLDTTVIVDAYFEPGTWDQHVDDFAVIYGGIVGSLAG